MAGAGRRADDDRRMSSDSGFRAWGPDGCPSYFGPGNGHFDNAFPLSRPLLLLLLLLLLRLLLWRLR